MSLKNNLIKLKIIKLIIFKKLKNKFQVKKLIN